MAKQTFTNGGLIGYKKGLIGYVFACSLHEE